MTHLMGNVSGPYAVSQGVDNSLEHSALLTYSLCRELSCLDDLFPSSIDDKKVCTYSKNASLPNDV